MILLFAIIPIVSASFTSGAIPREYYYPSFNNERDVSVTASIGQSFTAGLTTDGNFTVVGITAYGYREETITSSIVSIYGTNASGVDMSNLITQNTSWNIMGMTTSCCEYFNVSFPNANLVNGTKYVFIFNLTSGTGLARYHMKALWNTGAYAGGKYYDNQGDSNYDYRENTNSDLLFGVWGINITAPATPLSITQMIYDNSITLNGGTTKNIYVMFNVSSNQFDDTSAIVKATNGVISRTSSSCTNSSTLFNCTISMQFYDEAGTWNINASVKDLSGSYVENSTASFTLNALDCVSQNTNSLKWTGVSLGANNVSADNTITLTNCGNQNYGTINIKAFDIFGLTSGNLINAEKFCVSNNQSSMLSSSILKEYYHTEGGNWRPVNTGRAGGQGFRVGITTDGDFTLSHISISMKRSDTIGTSPVILYGTNSSGDANLSNILAINTSWNANTGIVNTGVATFVNISMPSILLTNGTRYVIYFNRTSSGSLEFQGDFNSPTYLGGSLFDDNGDGDGTQINRYLQADAWFEIWGKTQSSGSPTHIYLQNNTNIDVSSILNLNYHNSSATKDMYFFVDVPTQLGGGEYRHVNSWTIALTT